MSDRAKLIEALETMCDMADLAASHWDQGDLDQVIQNMQTHKESARALIAKVTKRR